MYHNTLPQPINQELFDLQFGPSDVAVDFLVDEIAKTGLQATVIENHGLIWTIAITDGGRLKGKLRIQRLDGNFAIEAAIDGDRFLPATGDWETISKYCRELKSVLDKE